jgi:nucleoside-diphosphate-sugar epimerase
LARCLIVGCGCRGRSVARELVGRGNVVRGTTRRAERCSSITAAGAEAIVADPDRVASLAPALLGVGVVCVLLGSAGGSAEQLAALHGPRLEMLLLRVLDTPVRGFVYESSGSVDPVVLRAGAELVSSTCTRSRIPFALVDADAAPAIVADAVESCLLGEPATPDREQP